MIESFRLRNFKCFADESVALGALTLLTGLNGAGKSSVLQGMLLLRQSFQQGLLGLGRLALNGDLVQLGTAQDALYGYAEEERIGFDLLAHEVPPQSWTFIYNKDADVLATEEASSAPEGGLGSAVRNAAAGRPARMSLFGDSFQYLCAERVGPRTSFATSDFLVREQRQLGIRGELTAHFLSTFGKKQRVAPGPLLRTDAPSSDLLAQVEAWLDFISPGTRIQLTSHRAMDAVQLGYQFVSGRDVTDVYRPTNVGFGLTYTLPILVAVLSAAPGALLLLENPEAHLHPRGQARMGELLALVASTGVQVIVETHSDHVLNGVRVAVHDGKLTPGSVRLHFFERKDAGERAIHQIVSPRMDRDGRIDQWPAGFFDEWDAALDKLLAPGTG
jgi:predicted ATPase